MLRSLLASLFVALAAFSAHATTVGPLTFEQLVNGSQAVVYGRVTEVRSQWTADRRYIESVVHIDVLRGMKGSAGESIAFTIPGGQVGRYLNVIPGAPSFAAGDLAVLFLTAQGPRLPITTGFTQGIYRVRRNAATGEMLVVPPAAETAGRIVRGDVKRKPESLDTFEGRVKAVGLRQAQAHPERRRRVAAR